MYEDMKYWWTGNEGLFNQNKTHYHNEDFVNIWKKDEFFIHTHVFLSHSRFNNTLYYHITLMQKQCFSHDFEMGCPKCHFYY